MTKGEALYYLAAIIDGEGCISYTDAPSGSKWWQQIYVANTEKDIIKRTEECLTLIGVDCNIRITQPKETRHSPLYTLHITGRDNLEKMFAQVPFASERKKETLELIVNSYARKKAHRRVPRHARPVNW
jgi:hypothetical protein